MKPFLRSVFLCSCKVVHFEHCTWTRWIRPDFRWNSWSNDGYRGVNRHQISVADFISWGSSLTSLTVIALQKHFFRLCVFPNYWPPFRKKFEKLKHSQQSTNNLFRHCQILFSIFPNVCLIVFNCLPSESTAYNVKLKKEFTEIFFTKI